VLALRAGGQARPVGSGWTDQYTSGVSGMAAPEGAKANEMNESAVSTADSVRGVRS
jgi:hypothetical protein